MSTADQVSVTAGFINRVYGWMSGGLTLTGVIAYLIGTDPVMARKLAANPGLLWGAIIGEFILVIAISAGIKKMSVAVASGCYLLYSALTGVVLSLIFLTFTLESIATTFFITALTFGAMSIYGYVTKRDLTSIGNLCLMALIGLIIASVINIFIGSSALYWVVTYVGILIFVGLTAYDTQKIKEMSIALGPELSAVDAGKKYAIMGALTLYLDFINLFLLLLRIFGNSRD
ncbi:MAG: Bax inhibitor-1/YccA family protein [Victivallaceae bacterium]|nr:Bax inhibitor-1/YccA family protein [Victivallaceae bacterium]